MADSAAPAPAPSDEPATKRARDEPSSNPELLNVLREIRTLSGDPDVSVVETAEAERVRILKIILAKLKEAPIDKTAFKIYHSGGAADIERDTYRKHEEFITDLMEMRGWTCTDTDIGYTKFGRILRDADAVKIARELGWI